MPVFKDYDQSQRIFRVIPPNELLEPDHPVLEALHVNTPMIEGLVGCIHDMLKNNGLLPLSDSKPIADRTKKLY